MSNCQEHSSYPIDEAELQDIRAGQRTFDLAYLRTALGTLSYAVIILKVFDKRFFGIGLLYTILSFLLFLLTYVRVRHSKLDYSNDHSSADNSLDAPSGRVFGRSFVTAGWMVVVVSTGVAIMEAGVLVLVVNI